MINLTAEEAAAVLGVKPATLYAYVSRGRLTRVKTPDGSRFDATEVERLARSSRRAQAAGGAPVGFASELTLIEGGRYFYRGRDAVALSRSWEFEEVAGWLWQAARPGTGSAWEAPPAGLDAARSACAVLRPATGLTDRWKVAAAAAASVDPLRHDRAPATVTAIARGLIATLVEVLPVAARRPGASAGTSLEGTSLAARLWPRLSPLPATAARTACLDAALVLLADHEIAASTLAARTAAAVGADPYAVALTGMSAAGGPLHAANSLQVRPLLADTARLGAAGALGQLLGRGGGLPGVGHPLYPDGDPRAAELLDRLRSAGADLEAVDALLELLAARGTPPPNVDLALAALAHAYQMAPDASEAVFVLGRCAGWVAHALEEYGQRSRFRVRATYVGPRPAAEPGPPRQATTGAVTRGGARRPER